MKKYLILLIILGVVLLTGCTKPDPQPTINFEKVGDIVDSIEIMYYDFDNIAYSNVEVQDEINRIRTSYDELNEDEKAMVTNYEDFLKIEQGYKSYLADEQAKLEEAQKVQKAVEEAADYALNLIPSKNTGEDINLPYDYTSEDGITVNISWKSNKPQTITNQGKVTQPRKSSTKVTISAECYSGKIEKTVSKTVTVGPLAYEKLPEKPVFAYYYSNQRALTDIERETIDVINLSFGGIDENGEVYVTGLNYATVLQERKYGIRVCFSVQKKEGFVEWTSTAAKREKLAQSFVDVCNDYHFDGVDIDWEYPDGTSQVNNYVAFMELLYTKMKAANSNYIVSSAMYGGNGVSKYNAGKSHIYMDYIHLMTYDLNSNDFSQHLTSLRESNNGYSSVEETVNYYLNAGVPKEKLIIGAGFYGKVYELSLSGTKFIGEKPVSKPESILYSSIKDTYLSMIGKESNRLKVERRWDSVAQAAYLCITEYDGNGKVTGRKFITYDDTESISLKCKYLFDLDLGGLMFWELGYEDRKDNDLVKAVKEGFNK